VPYGYEPRSRNAGPASDGLSDNRRTRAAMGKVTLSPQLGRLGPPRHSSNDPELRARMMRKKSKHTSQGPLLTLAKVNQPLVVPSVRLESLHRETPLLVVCLINKPAPQSYHSTSRDETAAESRRRHRKGNAQPWERLSKHTPDEDLCAIRPFARVPAPAPLRSVSINYRRAQVTHRGHAISCVC
jgi:hypothetical protein